MEKNKLIDYAGLFLIGILSLGYLLFGTSFAKLHIYLNFIKAPFFVGEFVFVICAILFIIKWSINKPSFNIPAYLFLFYLAFVFIKTLAGYLSWGPLSLRHSVLFLYPIFAGFTYNYYRKDFFKPIRNLLLIFTFILIFKFLVFDYYLSFACLILAIILINTVPERRARYIFHILLLLAFPYKDFFNTSRTFIVSNTIAMIYLGIGSVYILKIKRIFKVTFLLLLIAVVFWGVARYSTRSAVMSLFGFERLIEEYNIKKEALPIRERTFVEPNFNIKLYNDQDTTIEKFNLDLFKKKFKRSPKTNRLFNSLVSPAFARDGMPLDSGIATKIQKKEFHSEKKIDKKNIAAPLDDNSYGNSVFRILIWEDALRELVISRAVFGFDFGKPLRPKMLFILNMGGGEWGRDGWVCMHNSYLDIVYRAGVVGVLMIGFILIMVLFLIIKSFQSRSLTGILLTGILINLLIAANFLEILEMPYSAIPFWSIFGLAYAQLFKKTSL